MTDEIKECYHLFELEPGVTAEAVKQAYRDLLKVWHPDRFPDAKFQERATEKTKALNEAYRKITAYLSDVCTESPAAAEATAAAENDTQPGETEENSEEDEGLGEEQDFASTLELAREGNPLDQIALAEMYLEGTKIPKNEAEAFRWYLAAASQGDCQGMYNVGVSYFQGLGVERNTNEAIKWLSRLAYPETTEDCSGLSLMLYAQMFMAAIYRIPGETYDPATAYGWLLLAICYGQPWNVTATPFNARILSDQREMAAMLEAQKENLELELTTEQRAKGQKMAAELFRPKDYLDARADQVLRERLKEQAE
jgi:TPR repeat protein